MLQYLVRMDHVEGSGLDPGGSKVARLERDIRCSCLQSMFGRLCDHGIGDIDPDHLPGRHYPSQVNR